jgi:hypothetical protein
LVYDLVSRVSWVSWVSWVSRVSSIILLLTASILSGVTIEEAKRRITESLPENPIDSDSEEEVTTSLRDKLRAAAVAPSEDAVVGGAASASSSAVDDHANNESSSQSLTLPNSERQLVAFSSPALEYYKTREFQGLTPEIPEGLDTDIKQGHYGIAAGYQRYEGPVRKEES